MQAAVERGAPSGVPTAQPLFDAEHLNRVLAYKNDALVHRFVTKLHLSQGDAEELFEDTKRFLFLCGGTKHEGPLAPPEMVDEGWHNFILFTEDYAKFCHTHFGNFIHHRPRRPEDPPGDGGATRNTVRLMGEVFGNTPSKNWGTYGAPMMAGDCREPSTNCQDAPPEDCATNQ